MGDQEPAPTEPASQRRDWKVAVKPRSELKTKAWRHPIHTWHQVTRSLRTLPDFLIIGAQKSGTTSLYHYLVQHDQILPAKTKEIHYFDRHYHRPLAWYRASFPLRARTRIQRLRNGGPVLTGEATPDYLFDPNVPARVERFDSTIPLVAVLRNPVDRAYSHYHHTRDHGWEPLGFEEALEQEAQRLEGEADRLAEDPSYMGHDFYRYSYRTRGHYATQLERWLDHFERDQLLVLASRRLQDRPQQVLDDVTHHLGLSSFDVTVRERRNTRDYAPMDPSTRRRLEKHYEPHNERLFDLLGRELDW